MPSGHRPQPPVGTARVAIQGTGGAGNPFVNVFWLNITATTHVQADLDSILGTIAVSYDTRFAPYLSSVVSVQSVKGSWLYAAGNVVEDTHTVSFSGTGASSAESDQVCTLLNWSISDYYRGGHPRTYLPGVPSGQVSNGRLLNGTFRSNVASAAAGFLSDVNAATHGGISAVALGTVRFASGNAWLSPPVFRAYGGVSVNAIVATQRRRLAR